MALADMVAFWKVDTLYVSMLYFKERDRIAFLEGEEEVPLLVVVGMGNLVMGSTFVW